MHLLLGTANKGKIIEISEAFSGLPVTFKIPADFGIHEEPHEHGTTFADNALLKAEFYHSKAGIPTLADDSGIIVEALHNELGVQTRRWGAGPKATDKEWIEYFLQRMKKEKNKRARFVCSLAFLDAKGTKKILEGVSEGVITDALEAEYLEGLPISACFRPDGYDAVYSAMTIEQKNSTSHRGKAMKRMREFLETSFL